MARNATNKLLQKAKKSKSDEFYTQLCDIESELEHYKIHFRNKVVFCNCDDPLISNFFNYFASNFEELGLKKLIAACYKEPIENSIKSIDNESGYYYEYNGHLDEKCKPTLSDIVYFNGDGDFRNDESIELLKQSDIIVTNPPFSLFREYLAQLVSYKKKFLIIGNVNAITYKEVFPLIRANKMWSGATISSGDREFQVPEHYPLNASGFRVDEDGNKFIRVKGVRWFTNFDHGRRHEPLQLMNMDDNLRFNKKMQGKESYDRYDNYDAIEVPFTNAIPSDYFGVMGVPISFLDKYNPEQFEILGATESEGRGFSNGLWITDSKVTQALINGNKVYKRIFIRHVTTLTLN